LFNREAGYDEMRRRMPLGDSNRRGLDEDSINTNKAVGRRHEDRAETVPFSSLHQKVQRVSGAVLGAVFYSVQIAADPAIA
jgi:hypothetical protein